MPGGDRTGPLGDGPMTGRQLGYGAGYDSPGYTKGPGGGFGRGFRGRGRGFFWSRQAVVPEDMRGSLSRTDELGTIKSEVRDLKNTLSSILERLDNLNPKEDKK
ncbi:MAG: DUF5320 domain-containing protein [Calditrichia bacterium]|nr:DUF5320 domain-containing protein [Calditrichia bacterium]